MIWQAAFTTCALGCQALRTWILALRVDVRLEVAELTGLEVDERTIAAGLDEGFLCIRVDSERVVVADVRVLATEGQSVMTLGVGKYGADHDVVLRTAGWEAV